MLCLAKSEKPTASVVGVSREIMDKASEEQLQRMHYELDEFQICKRMRR